MINLIVALFLSPVHAADLNQAITVAEQDRDVAEVALHAVLNTTDGQAVAQK